MLPCPKPTSGISAVTEKLWHAWHKTYGSRKEGGDSSVDDVVNEHKTRYTMDQNGQADQFLTLQSKEKNF